MGIEVESTTFSEEDFRQFRVKLREETKLLKNWFEEKVFDSKPYDGWF